MAALAAILLPSFLTAQITFQRTYGGVYEDYGSSVQQTTDGGYVVAGTTTSFGAGQEDIYVLRLDAYGDTVWTRTYGGPGFDEGHSAQQTKDSGFVIAGDMDDSGGGLNVFLIKTDAHGNEVWTGTYGYVDMDFGWSVQQTTDSGYVVAGYTFLNGTNNTDVYLVKTDAHGDTLWTRTFGGLGSEAGYSVRQTTDGGYIVAGLTSSFGAGGEDVYLVRTNANGDTTWTRTFGGSQWDIGYSVQQTTDAGFIIVGYAESFGTRGDVYLIKTDASGDTLWTKTFGGDSNDCGESVRQTADGGYIVAGTTSSFGSGGVYLVKTDANGDTEWTRTYGGTNSEWSMSVGCTSDGGYVIIGATQSFGAGLYDVYLIKTDSLGNVAVAEPRQPQAASLKLQAEPNPCRSSTVLHLTTGPLDHSTTLRIYDASGRLVWSEPVRTSSLILHPSSLPAGAYFLRLNAGDQHATTRLVVQR